MNFLLNDSSKLRKYSRIKIKKVAQKQNLQRMSKNYSRFFGKQFWLFSFQNLFIYVEFIFIGILLINNYSFLITKCREHLNNHHYCNNPSHKSKSPLIVNRGFKYTSNNRPQDTSKTKSSCIYCADEVFQTI